MPDESHEGFIDLGFAKPDTARAKRQGIGEVILGQGKTPEQITEIARRLYDSGQETILVTRLDADAAQAVGNYLGNIAGHYHATSRVLVIGQPPAPDPARLPGEVAVVCAGTSDLPVAEEAAVCCESFGQAVRRIYDVGVAGLHRLLAHEDQLRTSRVLIVVAGMEGALPSVVAGLVDRPVIAVPTSIGYGANLGGIAALLGMLNSCGSGVTVVNIDNGFGAAFAAVQINRLGQTQV